MSEVNEGTTNEAQVTDTAATPAVAAPVAEDKKNGVKRPVSGSITGKLWDIADRISASNSRPATRKEVVDAYMTEVANANQATANTQYARWVTYNGASAILREQRLAETSARRDAATAAKEQAKAAKEAERLAKAEAEGQTKEQVKAERDAKAAAEKAEKEAEKKRKADEREAAKVQKAKDAADAKAQKAAEKAEKQRLADQAKAQAAATAATTAQPAG